MTDDDAGFYRQLTGLATDWVSAKRRSLQRGQPNTVTDSGGSLSSYRWQGQELDRGELRKVKQIREKGGLIASLFDKKALIRFGGGAELQSEDDDLQVWLDENYQEIDLTVLDLGLDATYYPYGLGENVETRGGEFSHVEFVEPWTMLPKTNKYGEIVIWEQETQGMGNEVTPFQPEEIGSIVINKAAARDTVGVSEILRNEEEITQYKENQQAIDKALEVAAYPHHWWKVGVEGRTPVDDNDLRRFRNLVDDLGGDTQLISGPGIEHEQITPGEFDFEKITKRDLRILTTAIGLPFEVAGYGREGMGSGSETDLISDLQSLENRVARRRFETQFIEEFVRPAVRDYAPYDHEQPIELVISPFRDETDDIADLIAKIGDYMNNAEIRERLDLPPLEDDEMAESYRPPKQIEEAEEEDQTDDPMGGFFGEKAKQAVDSELDKRDLQSGELTLVDDGTPDFDRHYLTLLEGHAWGENTDKTLIGASEVPEMVQNRLRETIMSGAIFSDIESIPSSERMQLQEYMMETLTDGDSGWTTDGLADQLMQLEGIETRDQAEVIARSETSAVINTARQDAYESRGLEDDTFQWVGTSDNRTTEACEWLKSQTNPDHGGDPVTLERLKELVEEAPSHDPDMQDDLARPDNYVVHPNERHTFTRYVD